MICSNCGHDNLPEARFCAHCGAALAAPPIGEVPVATEVTPAAAIPAETQVRRSYFPAAVGFFLFVLILGPLLFGLRDIAQYDPLRAILPLAGVGGGVAVVVWPSLRFHLEGRLTSALGMVLIIVGAVMAVAVTFRFYDGRSYYTGSVISFFIVGVGLSLLFPAAFWRHLNRVPSMWLGILMFSALLGLAWSYWVVSFLLEW